MAKLFIALLFTGLSLAALASGDFQAKGFPEAQNAAMHFARAPFVHSVIAACTNPAGSTQNSRMIL